MAEAHASLVPGKQITKGVELVSPLGAGGMGAVWLADHHGLKTRVVVKFMLVGLDGNDGARTRFSREAAAAAHVKSPHVVQMLDHGVSDDGVPFIVMEHLLVHELGLVMVKHGALEAAKVVAIVTQVAKALTKVHAAGLLHRDIKPDNIFLVEGEEDVFVKLLDFGIAKSSVLDGSTESMDSETKTGQIVGTPFYMSPEQVTAQKTIDHRSDLWALGVVAFEALTGVRPFDGPSFGALAVKIATGKPLKPTEVNASLPEAVDLWFEKACAREASARFASAKELSDAFRAAFEGVISLPAAAISSDSGRRGQSPSGPGATDVLADSGSATRATAPGAAPVSAPALSSPAPSSGSGGRPVSPTFGLAATAVDTDSGRRDAALGQSEAGVSVAGGSAPAVQHRSPGLLLGGAVLAIVLVIGGIVVATRASNPSNDAPPVVPTVPVPATSSASLPAAASAPIPLASAPPSASAAPSASIQPAPSSKPVASAPSSPRVPTRPTAKTPDASAPTARPKPTTTEPDLF